MTQIPTKAEELAARAETLAIAEALERRFGCSALVLTADIERAAAELRRLSAENTAAVSSFLAADDERRELRAERDALRAGTERWRSLYTRAINEANGLTNYVEDRPELRRAEKQLEAIQREARAIDAAMKGTT